MALVWAGSWTHDRRPLRGVIYPESSPGGSRLLKLLKFSTWNTWSYNGTDSSMQQVSLPSVGTAWHTLTLSLSNSQITVSYDTNRLISVTDTEATPYTSGGVCVSMWTETTRYFLSVDNVTVTSLTGGTAFSRTVPASDRVARLGRRQSSDNLDHSQRPDLSPAMHRRIGECPMDRYPARRARHRVDRNRHQRRR